MAEEYLKEIYEISEAMTSAEILIERYRKNAGTSNFKRELKGVMDSLSSVAKSILLSGNLLGKTIWESVKRIPEYTNMISILDELEENCIPAIREYLKGLNKIDVDDGTVKFKSSSSGYLYLSDNTERFDSSVNPMKEAYYIAKNIYYPYKRKYVFLGCGLGYIPYQLFMLSEGEIEITIIFHDEKSMEYANSFGVLDKIDESKINMLISDNAAYFVNKVKECDDYYFYLGEVKRFSEADRLMLDMYVKGKTTYYATREINVNNFYRNIRETDKFISSIPNSFSRKIIIVAGGPSVDDNIEFIRSAKEQNMSVISVGTVLKKLLSLGIKPDVVTACDPFNAVASQFTDLGDLDIPLVMGMQTNWKVAKSYKGSKYFVATKDETKEINDYVREKDEYVFPEIMTVTHLAFLLAVYWGAEEIYLVGADFGYPGGVSHAFGTAYRKNIDENPNLIKEIDVNGNEILSDYTMRAYRNQLEEFIQDNPKVRVYNMSKSGVKINGTL